jgi:hypothetical protein
MSAKHTPGPWLVVHHYDGCEYAVCTESTKENPAKRTIALLDDGVVGYRNKENARLIAAAPEMLEALEIICNEVTSLTFDQLCLIKNAIRKARGES